MKAFYVLILCFCVVFEAQSNPFSESSSRQSILDECLYSEVYSASSKTYLMLNILESLAFSKEELKKDLVNVVLKASELATKSCSEDQTLSLADPVFEDNKLVFGFGAGLQSLEWIEEKNNSFYLIYKKLYGTYENEPLYVAKFKDGKKRTVRITGRLGAERSSQRYTLFYKKNEKTFFKKFKLNNKNFRDLRSLKSIYGNVPEKKTPLIKVGVIGTGVDYNHPGMAHHLAYRFEMEKDLLSLEGLENLLRSEPLVSEKKYEKTYEKYQKLKAVVGFPTWMDQALGTRNPYDAVIINQKFSRGGTREHETRVASRIIRTGGPVELHFARRSMGSMDILNVKKVVREFVEKGVSLINLSFGSKCGALPLEEQQWDEVFAEYKDVVFVVSAGNSGFNTEVTPFCPATFSKKYKNVISVTALSDDGQLAVYFDTPVNFGVSVDLAIKSDNLDVLVPFRKVEKWENNANGATSLAAAEVSRILAEAKVDGLEWSAQTVKDLLVNSSIKRPVLEGVNTSGSEVDEWAFRAALKKSR